MALMFHLQCFVLIQLILILLILILLQLLIQMILTLLILILILVLLKLTLLTALMLLIAHPQAMIVEEEQRFSALSSNAPEVFVCHFQTSSTRLQCEHGRPSYGPVVQDPAWLHGTHCIQWCSRKLPALDPCECGTSEELTEQSALEATRPQRRLLEPQDGS